MHRVHSPAVLRLCWILCLMLMMIGCQRPEPGTSPATSPLSPLSPQGENTPGWGPIFTLDPLREGDIVVTGTGPANLPIRVIDLSQAGDQIGGGLIEQTGRFNIAVSSPVIGGNRIGIQIGDLTSTPFRYEDFISGPGYRDYPMIGVVFTSTLATRD